MKKALSVIEIQILMVVVVIGLFGFSFLLNFLQENMWIVYTVVISIIFMFVSVYFQSQEEKKCKKCFSKNTKVVDSEDRIVGWKYETKKGYPDKRRKNNFVQHLENKGTGNFKLIKKLPVPFYLRGVTIGLPLDGLWVAKYVNPYRNRGQVMNRHFIK